MDVLVIGGTPSSGKSRVILAIHRSGRARVGVAKVDCVATSDDRWFRAHGIPAMQILAGRYCPDHAWMERWPEVLAWARRQEIQTLCVETAGLCARCAPYLFEAAAICVLDCTCGVHAPDKLGPHLSDADLCVLTKADLISQAEREVLETRVRRRNPTTPVVRYDGLTGEGASDLLRAIATVRKWDWAGDRATMRTPLPQMFCSYCLGRTEVGISTL